MTESVKLKLARCFVALLSLGAAVSVSAQLPPAGVNVTQCDKRCLRSAVDSYLEALVAHDPDRLPWTVNPRFVENARPMFRGQGLWQTATAVPDTFRIYVPDEVTQEIGFLGVMQENDEPILLALRIALDNGRIAQAEHLIARNLSEESLANLQTPRPAFSTLVPPSEQISRQAMLETAGSYYVALQGSDGSAAPFADDCVRRENGMQTTSNPPPDPAEPPSMATFGALGCKAQLDTQIMSYIDRIDDRRVEIADVETGLVFGLSHFRHSMRNRNLKIIGMPGIDTWEMDFDPFDLPAAHIFKISGGKIHEIEAMGFMAPYNSRTGWE